MEGNEHRRGEAGTVGCTGGATWKVWFRIVNESKWVTAAKEWDTKELATTHALGKFMAWSAAEDWTVRETGDDPNE